MSSHLEKTHAWLKANGYIYAKVEYFNPWSRTTLDLFGLVDSVALKADGSGNGMFCTNSCGEDVGPHLKKYMSGYVRPATEKRPEKVFGPNECLLPLLQNGNQFELFAWRKRGAKGERKLWTLRRVQFFIFDGKVMHREVAEEQEV